MRGPSMPGRRGNSGVSAVRSAFAEAAALPRVAFAGLALLVLAHTAEAQSACPSAATMAYIEACDSSLPLQKLKYDTTDQKLHNTVLTGMCASDCGDRCFSTKLVMCDAADVGIFENGCSNPAALGGAADRDYTRDTSGFAGYGAEM